MKTIEFFDTVDGTIKPDAPLFFKHPVYGNFFRVGRLINIQLTEKTSEFIIVCEGYGISEYDIRDYDGSGMVNFDDFVSYFESHAFVRGTKFATTVFVNDESSEMDSAETFNLNEFKRDIRSITHDGSHATLTIS